MNNFNYLYANMDKNNTFLLTVIILIIFLLVLIAIISYISKLKEKKILIQKREEYKKNRRNNIKKPLDFSDLDEEKPKVEPITKKEEKEEEIEIIEIMDESTDKQIENIKNRVQEGMNQDPIKLNKYEQEQEKTAIISYDELVKKAGAKKIIYKQAPKEEVKKTSSFKPSTIVSPIYGIQNKNIEKMEHEIDSFNKIEKLKVRNRNEEMIDDVEFLNKLKKFRSELN